MVLISRNAACIPHAFRVLGEDCIYGKYVKISPYCYILLASVRDVIEETYFRHFITDDEYLHYVMTIAAVHNGYYFDSRVRLAALDDPRIKMNIVTFLEVYGEELKVDPSNPPTVLTIDDIDDLEDSDDYLDYDCRGNDIRPFIPDETFENEVIEVVDLRQLPDEPTHDIDGFEVDLENDSTFDHLDNSILADIINFCNCE